MNAPEEERYRLLFERSQAGVYRSTLDGQLTDCNDAFLLIFGFGTREEALERRTTSLYADPRDRAHLLDRLLAEGGVVKEEFRVRRQNGSPRWVVARTSLFRDADGSPSYMEGTIIDVDERRRAEEALRASEARLHALLDNMLGGLFMADPRGILELVNPAAEKMFGYTSAELVGKYLGTVLSLPPGVEPGVFLRDVLGSRSGRSRSSRGGARTERSFRSSSRCSGSTLRKAAASPGASWT